MSLFPTAQRNNHLVQFNAGKCIRDGNWIKPETRKGLIYMDQSDDQLMHFYWKERKASTPEDDFIIFPDEAELLAVNECTTGRVYVLKFKSSSQKVFYWLQNKNDEKDKELVDRVNQLINNPSGAFHEDETDDFEGNPHSDLIQVLRRGTRDTTQDNILRFIQDTSDPLVVVPASSWIDLETKLSETTVPEEQATLEVNDVLNTVTLNPILGDPIIRSALFPFVSESSERSPHEIEQIVSSQQFKQRLQLLHSAIEQDKLTSILGELNAEKNIVSFLKAASVQARYKQDRGSDDMEED